MLFSSTAWRRYALRALAALPLIALAAWIGGQWAWQSQLDTLADERGRDLAVQSTRLNELIDRYASTPAIAALHPAIPNVVANPRDPAARDAANRYLQELVAQLDADVAYVMDARGQGIAASNWDQATTFVGIDLSYRPYFKEALVSGNGRFWGIGTTSNRPGYFFAHLVRTDNLVGVVAVKVDLMRLAASWQPGARTFAVDESGVVLLTANPAWRYRPLSPLPAPVRREALITRQYEGQDLSPIGLQTHGQIRDGAALASLDPQGGARLLMQQAPVGQSGWRVVTLTDLRNIRLVTAQAAALSALSAALLLLGVALFAQRRRAHLRERAARDALLRAKRDLEEKVSERTRALVEANDRLRDEVNERARTADALRATQDELVHAGKLAVLGQMAAGVTHELNQPLAALRALSDNTQVLLERDMRDEARDTVARIGGLVERMAAITNQLRLFARKGAPTRETAPLAPILASARLLLDARLRKRDILVVETGTQGLAIVGDPARLEQVFVNLLSNAIDALNDTPSPRIELIAHRDGDEIHVAVRDNGPGVPDALLPRIFDPFVTAKAAGAGLGLGLTISHKILRDGGGSLHARNLPEGGAEFLVELPAASAQPESKHV